MDISADSGEQKGNRLMNSITLAKWNDEMVEKYHKDGTIFESSNPILRYIEKNRVSKILELASHPGESTILDLGCGEGYLLSLIPNAQDVVGLDISNRALGKAKDYLKSHPQINLLCGDGQILCFKDNSFDIVICSEMIEHVPDPKLVIKEIHRILKPNGILVVSIPDEMRIKKIMRIMCYLKLDKLLPGIRKHETYDGFLFPNAIVYPVIIRGQTSQLSRKKVWSKAENRTSTGNHLTK